MLASPLAIAVALLMLPPPSEPLESIQSRFPPPQHIRACVNFNRDYQLWLERQILWAKSGGRDCQDMEEALSETKHLHAVYDAIGGAVGYDGPSMESNPEGATVYRLQWLGRFRELAGDAAYWSGELPPPVPCHRFTWTGHP